jgi:hypothetical protein
MPASIDFARPLVQRLLGSFRDARPSPARTSVSPPSQGRDEFIDSLVRVSRGVSGLQDRGVLPKPPPSSGDPGADLVDAVRKFADIFKPLIRAVEWVQGRTGGR